MKYSINGFGTPMGSISWDKSISAKERFQSLLIFLEGKRILVNPSCMEQRRECIECVVEIKKFLGEITIDASFNRKDANHVRTLLSACNDYLDYVKIDNGPHLIYKKDDSHWEDAFFDMAMKRFRKAFKDEIQIIEKEYALEFDEVIPDNY